MIILRYSDYTANGRMIVIEKVDRLIFENAGNFYDGKPEDYFSGDRTPQHYRNPWLAQAMVNLNMIDTVGHGIHSMILTQRSRYFPPPDHAKSLPNKVVLEKFGHLIDENYTKLLLEHQDAPINGDFPGPCAKKQPSTDTAAAMLRRQRIPVHFTLEAGDLKNRNSRNSSSSISVNSVLLPG